MKRYFSRFLVVLGALIISVQLNAQTDSTDLNLSLNPPLLLDEMDSLLYPEPDYSNLVLEFDISDSVNFGAVHFELHDLGSSALLLKERLDLSELISMAIIDDWHVTVNLGNLANFVGYKVSVLIENDLGLLGPVIQKHI